MLGIDREFREGDEGDQALEGTGAGGSARARSPSTRFGSHGAVWLQRLNREQHEGGNLSLIHY